MKILNLLHIHTIRFFLLGILVYFPILSVAGNVTTFSSVEAMIEEFNDYSASNGTFQVLASKPLHIQLSPQIVQGDLPEIIEEQVKRALVYGIYRVFIHTPINKITVTAIPQEIDFKTKKTRYAPKYKRTISKTRAEALALVKKHLGVSSFSDLVTETKVGNMAVPNQWSKDFNRLYYNDQGEPGLNRFVDDLAK
ncbi:hypothetical protein THII_3917 [Thioploca ingrica]|uniref:Uncharacterized protein n=1 Tax=Thioploca ingrica TaxID=40754 RepID=A0A090AKU2_9GAMM|nr:hypothetical protein THII_3917 [Thioploca ingrica]